MSGIGEELAERFDLPGEAAAGAPRITLSGSSRVMVENHRGLLSYSDTMAEIRGARLLIRVRGDGLLLRAMDRDVVLVGGTIFGVELEG